MDREALDRSLAKRLIDHIDNGTTDMAEGVLEVPTTAYTSDAHLRDELDAMFLSQPQVLGLSGALPEPNTYYALKMCDTPIVLTRDADGKAHCFANVCKHRGVQVVDEGVGEGRRLTCPFHAWVYDLHGKLVGVPVADGFEGMDRATKGLVELPCDEGYGLIVGRLRPGDPVDIDEYVGPGLGGELAVLDFADWKLFADPHVHMVNANWKVTLDTFRENYHFNQLHRTSLFEYAYGGVLTFDPFGPHLRNCSAIRSIDEIRGTPEEEWGDPSLHFSHQYSMFPSACISFDSRHVELWQVLPHGPHQSYVIHTQFLVPGLSEAQQQRAIEQVPWICNDVVDGEDFWVAGRTEPGLQTGMVDQMVFGRNEPAPQHLHKGFLAAVEALRARRAEQQTAAVEVQGR